MKRTSSKELNVQRLALKIIRRQQALLRILATYLNEVDGITEDLENLVLQSKMLCPRPIKKEKQ